MAKTGDQVEVSLGKQVLKGVMLPASDSNHIVLKQDSGYNIVLEKSKIKVTKIIKGATKIKSPQKSIKNGSKLPTIGILFTGGTIACKIDYETGGVSPLFSPGELFDTFPELKKLTNIETFNLSSVPSEDFDFSIYNTIAKKIKELDGKVKGIIVTQGTDTLHYSTSILSFILEDINMPVVVVGSQRSSDRGSTDSAQNVLSAAYFITKTDFKGVVSCMHETTDDKTCLILHAHNTRKMHTSRRDAFRPINRLPIADVNFKKKEINYYSEYDNKGGKTKLHPLNEKIKVGWIKHRPGIPVEEYTSKEKFDGLLIEGTGFGHVNINNPKILTVITKLSKKMPVIMTSQCLYGRVNLTLYTNGKRVVNAGVTPIVQGLTPETAYCKLVWLLSNFPKNKVAELFEKDFRGENILRITEETFLL